MKKLLLLPLLVVAFAFQQKKEIKPIDIGTVLPKADMKFENAMNGKQVSLHDEKQTNGLLVIFSCNTCPFVIANQDRMRQLQHDAQRLGIGVVIVNSNEGKRDGDDSKDAMRNYGNDQKFLAPYIVDTNSELADAFGATRTPESFLFDKNDKLVYHGAIDDSPKDESAVKTHYLLDAMTALSGGKEIKTKTTVSSGCSIKRK